MDQNIIVFIIVGFVAQMIDGALGMAYGVSATSFLLAFGVSPVLASASVHMAEVFTTAVSGGSHLRLGNVDKKLVSKLVIPGIIGAVIGAYLLTNIPGEKIKPYVSAYLLVMGIVILLKTLRKMQPAHVTSHLIPLGFIGGFFDTIGGGGWGPVVATTLIARGNSPRHTIGSVNLAEFFVTISAAATFLLTLGTLMWQPIVGLAIGGALAAPVAALVCKRIPARALMFVVGILIIFLSIRTIYQTVSLSAFQAISFSVFQQIGHFFTS
ncbi:MAG: sulfite exporter TauE/SafE family protein [Anaerolineales bacterium]|nr:sulfite exporter TauE/SafE family protein [Anaerolineales bacterium]MCB8990054.1 sulfite exporter TauE/SafE family protein [Ardenticatenaceae bacterium]MCB9005635.1 sulfite exporter TauE/SafE family protein [Ardenticatenaceae bacterium]